MALTLTQTADLTKRGLIFGVIFFFLFVMGISGYVYYKNFIYVPPAPPEIPPELSFGKLPKLEIPIASDSATQYGYTLDTETGDLPKDIPKTLKVYPVASLGTDLLALERSKNLAVKLHFPLGPQMISTTQYLYLDPYGGEMTVNLDTGNFKFDHKESTESADIEQTDSFNDASRMGQEFKSFLSSAELLKDQLKEGVTKVVYEKTSKNDSNFVTVSLWQEDVEKIPIVTEKFNEGLIKGVINKTRDRTQRLLILDYTFWPIDLVNGHTYPIIKPDEAYDKLQTGQAFIVVKPTAVKVSISKVYLGYYLSKNYQPFLQPVYVFEGDSFAAYVPAVSDDQVE